MRPSRNSVSGTVGATVAGVLAALFVLSGCSGSAPIAQPGPNVGSGMDRPLPAAVANTLLITSDGERLNLASLRGKIIVISDIMTLCQETCPLDTAEVLQAAQAVEKAGLGSKVEFLSITIDPERDTIPQLAAFRKLYGRVPANWQVVTGGTSQLASFWNKFGVYIQKVKDDETGADAPRNWRTGQLLTYDLVHSDDVIFVDADGNERFALDGAPQVSAGAPIPATLRAFLDADGHHNLTHPSAQAWTLDQELQVLSWLLNKRIQPSS